MWPRDEGAIQHWSEVDRSRTQALSCRASGARSSIRARREAQDIHIRDNNKKRKAQYKNHSHASLHTDSIVKVEDPIDLVEHPVGRLDSIDDSDLLLTVGWAKLDIFPRVPAEGDHVLIR